MSSKTKLPISCISKLDTKKNPAFFEKSQDVFDYLGSNLSSRLTELLSSLGVSDKPVIKGEVASGAYISGAVYIAEGVKIEPTAFIQGPCFIGKGSEVRHGAYIRGNVYVGENCVVGHSTEVKGSVFCDKAKAGHFAYVGDSFLGQNCNLGAGTKLANLKLNNKEVAFLHPETKNKVDSGLRKLGAIVGDDCQTGCNSVLSPGTILMPGTNVLPCDHFFGTKFAK